MYVCCLYFTLKMKYMPVVSNDVNDKKKMHICFSNTVFDAQKIETITIGDMTYIKSKEGERK